MRDVAAAVGALLDGDPSLYFISAADYVERASEGTLPDTGAPAFDGQVPSGAHKPSIYVVFYLTTPSPRGERLSGDAPLGLYSLSTLYVGSKPNECRWVAEKVHAALTRQRLDIPGRRSAPLAVGTAGQVRPDDGVNPPAYVCTDVWRFHLT